MERIFYVSDDDDAHMDLDAGWYVSQGEGWDDYLPPAGPFPTEAAATDWRDGLAFNGQFIQQAAE